MNFKLIDRCVYSLVRTCSMICRMVFNRTTPEDFSEPASFGSVSNKKQTSKHRMKISAMSDAWTCTDLGWNSLAQIQKLTTNWQWQKDQASQRPVSHWQHQRWHRTAPQDAGNQLQTHTSLFLNFLTGDNYIHEFYNLSLCLNLGCSIKSSLIEQPSLGTVRFLFVQ